MSLFGILANRYQSLHLRGRLVDVLEVVNPGVAHEYRTNNDALLGSEIEADRAGSLLAEKALQLLLWEADCWDLVHLLDSYPTGQPVEEAYWRTLICNVESIDSGLGVSMKECFEAFIDSLPILIVLQLLGAPLSELESSSIQDHSDISPSQPPHTIICDGGLELKLPETGQDKIASLVEDVDSGTNHPKNTCKEANIQIGNIHKSSGAPNPDVENLVRLQTAGEIHDSHLVHRILHRDGRPQDEISATPDMFTSRNLRVPRCVRQNPGLSLIEHIFIFGEKIEAFERAMQSLSFQRRFSTTIAGYMGWVPRSAKKGDLVCVFNGETIPFVIRLKLDGTYTFLGACYMHGLMDGGAFKLKNKTECTISMS